MKTLNERAENYSNKQLYRNISPDNHIRGRERRIYIDAAKEQRSIDIEKALDWLNCRYFSRKSPVAEQFKKYMEED